MNCLETRILTDGVVKPGTVICNLGYRLEFLSIVDGMYAETGEIILRNQGK